MTRPNIVFILTDDHAAHAIGAYGSRVNATPHIDAIGAAGARFENCLVTNSLCAPSRASILTGTWSHRNGVTTLDTPLEGGQPTFISQLQAAGYRTALFGKWHLGHGDGHDPEGFDQWRVLIDQGEYHDPRFLGPDGLEQARGYATDLITEMALGWLESLDGEAPWCVLIWHKAPHRPWEYDDAHAHLYSDGVPLPATFDDDHAGRSESVRRARMSIAEDLTATDLKEDPPDGLTGRDLTEWKYQRYLADYLRCIASVDDNVGRVSQWLTEHGHREDTVVVYSSDQGFFLGDHGWFDKRLMYEESLRMPLLISWPGRIAAGVVDSRLVTNVDLGQTLLAAAGVEAHQRMQGVSFLDGLLGADDPGRDGVYYRYWMHDDSSHHVPAHYGYRDHRWKLIRYYNDGLGLPGCSDQVWPAEWELYDLVEDPAELHNVWGRPDLAAVQAGLVDALFAAQSAVGDAPAPCDLPTPAL